MATVEVELRNCKKMNGPQALIPRVMPAEKISRKNTGLYILGKDWNADEHRGNRKHPHWSQLTNAPDALCKEGEGLKADITGYRAQVARSNS